MILGWLLGKFAVRKNQAVLYYHPSIAVMTLGDDEWMQNITGFFLGSKVNSFKRYTTKFVQHNQGYEPLNDPHAELIEECTSSTDDSDDDTCDDLGVYEHLKSLNQLMDWASFTANWENVDMRALQEASLILVNDSAASIEAPSPAKDDQQIDHTVRNPPPPADEPPMIGQPSTNDPMAEESAVSSGTVESSSTTSSEVGSVSNAFIKQI